MGMIRYEDGKVAKTRISSSRSTVDIFWRDDHVSTFHASWLRYNCRCNVCKRTRTGEYKIDRSEFPDQMLVSQCKVISSEEEIHFWIDGDTEDDHVVVMDMNWLRGNCYCDECLYQMVKASEMKFRDPADVGLPSIQYDQLDTAEGKFQWLKMIMDDGFCVVKNVPSQEQICIEITERFSPVVTASYDTVYEVKNLDSKEHVAYTTTALPLHQDVCHAETPGIILLHAIEFDQCIEGGHSIFVDMFAAVDILRKQSPQDFEVLTRVPVTFAAEDLATNEPQLFKNRRPLIEVDYDGQVVRCSWNPGTEQVLRVHGKDVDAFYVAYNKLHNIMKSKSRQYEYRLQPGDCVVSNNKRMLHTRTAFTSNGGRRRLQGCYGNIEHLRSCYYTLGRQLGHDVPLTKVANGSAI